MLERLGTCSYLFGLGPPPKFVQWDLNADGTHTISDWFTGAWCAVKLVFFGPALLLVEAVETWAPPRIAVFLEFGRLDPFGWMTGIVAAATWWTAFHGYLRWHAYSTRRPVPAFHSTEPRARRDYHDDARCPIGANLDPQFLTAGTGGRPRCRTCTYLRG